MAFMYAALQSLAVEHLCAWFEACRSATPFLGAGCLIKGGSAVVLRLFRATAIRTANRYLVKGRNIAGTWGRRTAQAIGQRGVPEAGIGVFVEVP